tara:strand:- start:179 stop:418 length:240 start_codon:yes stop_codon:yes gene_type:complete
MWKLLKWIIIIILIGGGLYYIMDYNSEKSEDNDFIKSTKEFSKDAAGKVKTTATKFLEGTKEAVDSSEILQKGREALKK